jgi:hypothetical protein
VIRHLLNRLAHRGLPIAFLAVAALAGTLAPSQARGQAPDYSLTVNSASDAASPGDCDPAHGTCPTLRAAIDFANGLAGTNTVSVALPAGTYDLGQGQLQVTNAALTLSIGGAGAAETVVERADSAPPSRIFDICASATGAPPCLSPGPTVSLSGVTIGNGSLADGNGAGILNLGGILTLTGVVVTGNSITVGSGAAGQGAGIFSNGTLTIDRSSVSENSLLGCDDGSCGTGAAGIGSRLGDLTITSSTISGNRGTNAPGGVNSAKGGTTTITNSTVSDNSAVGPASPGGGGISTFGASPLTHFVLTNDTIASNSATGEGAGIELGGAPASALTMQSTIVAQNRNVDTTTGSTADGNCDAPVTSSGYNLDSGDTCALTGPGDLSATDPELGPLRDNGGPTFTQALLAGSPAIDAVASAACPPPATDQRGVSRPQGSGCDIGAFELLQDTTPPLITVPGPITADATSPGGAVVTYSVSAQDPDDKVASLTCVPASGSTFPIGTTTVACAATDTHGNTGHADFTVHVEGADEQLTDLGALLDSFDVGRGTAGKLENDLRQTARDLARGNAKQACEELAEFGKRAVKESGKKLTADEADQLLEAASRIRAVLGC